MLNRHFVNVRADHSESQQKYNHDLKCMDGWLNGWMDELMNVKL